MVQLLRAEVTVWWSVVSVSDHFLHKEMNYLVCYIDLFLSDLIRVDKNSLKRLNN